MGEDSGHKAQLVDQFSRQVEPYNRLRPAGRRSARSPESDPRTAFREMARICRPGGRIVVRDVTPAADRAAVYDRMEKLRDPSHTRTLTPGEMYALGARLSMEPSVLHPGIAADLPLDPILAASFPESRTIADVREMFREDALSGESRLGFDARIVNGELCVSFPQTMAIWIK